MSSENVHGVPFRSCLHNADELKAHTSHDLSALDAGKL
jgi:hypothetical protein